jgi:hypothetical protein
MGPHTMPFAFRICSMEYYFAYTDPKVPLVSPNVLGVHEASEPTFIFASFVNAVLYNAVRPQRPPRAAAP